jgi:stage II sporulation protein R
VVARSDAPDDQRQKLVVRDRVRALAAEIVRGAKNADEAFARLRARRGALARASGGRVEIREVNCPLRVYGDLVVPAGRYRAVRVVLGGGAGRNWWCVLYPDLCGADPISAEALETDRPVAFYSEIMQWVAAMRGNDS